MIRRILRKIGIKPQSVVKKYHKEFHFLKSLQETLEFADANSNSTGTSLADYVILYKYIKQHKPQSVLECGTGKSTLVIAQAMLENHLDNPTLFPRESMRLISMENEQHWYKEANKNLPSKYQDFVSINYSELSTYTYSMLNGVIYDNIPAYKYDFMFIDGPPQAINSSITTCDIDLIKYVSTTTEPVSAIIDNRKHTVLACTLAFGANKVSFYPDLGIGYVDSVTKDDLTIGDKTTVRTTFFRDGTIHLNKKHF